MKIKCLTTFLDGADRFEKGDERTVSPERGAQFVANGWASDLSCSQPTGSAAAGAEDLIIHNSTHVSGDNHG